jgi:Tfp pilus assembly protein PilN
MLNINFVPDDYIQNNESRRTNLMYLILFGLVMSGLGGAFVTIKIRQHAVAAKGKSVNERLAKADALIEQFDQLQQKRNEMMKTALATAGLLEPVHRSVILASLTNNLPPGTSLLKLEINQEQPKNTRAQTGRQTRYQQAVENADTEEFFSPEKLLETKINIEGMASSDMQVAAFIKNLGASPLFDDVALIESKEEKTRNETKFRRFKLSAMLKKEAHITSNDIDYIREKNKNLKDEI